MHRRLVTTINQARRACVIAMFACTFFLCTVLAQDSTTVSGQVVDPTGASVPSAQITIVDPSGAERSAVTDLQGDFTISDLQPGTYTLRATSPGFASYENQSVRVPLANRAPLVVMLRIAANSQEITVMAGTGSILDADATAATLILRGAALDALPDGPGGLAAALRILTARSANPRGVQILVNGFSGGRLPPKSSIREIRINRDPFSAQYPQPGEGRVEIFTKPGTDTVHTGLYYYFNDESMNSRNPFVMDRPPFQSRLYGWNLSGPIIPKRAAFFLDFERHEADENSVINGTVLDENLNPVAFNSALPSPHRRTSMNSRIDTELSSKHTLAGRYAYNRSRSSNVGVGEFSLPSRAYASKEHDHTLQLTATSFGQRAVNELRFQYLDRHRKQDGGSTAPTIEVADAFIGGGADAGTSSNRQRTFELYNTTMWLQGGHSWRFGGHIHNIRTADSSSSQFNGTFTFSGRAAPKLTDAGEIYVDENGLTVMERITNLESYRRTLLFQSRGLAPDEIRARGGGAAQFSIAGGDAQASVNQYNASVFVQDDWRIRRNFTFSTGLRYEVQNHLRSNLNFAPRVGFAWAPGKADDSKWVFRGGFGLFYERFAETYTLEARRRNGILQREYIVSDPLVLDGFPSVPPVETLSDFAIPQTVTRVADNLASPYMMQTSFTVDRALPGNMSFAATWVRTRALRLLRSRNINAPLAGGERPLGNVGEVYQYESSGRLNQNQFVANLGHYSGRVTFYINYVLNKAESDTEGAGSFPSNSHDLRSDYGRSAQDIRHNVYAGGWIKAPLGIDLSPIVVIHSGEPFDITLGNDLNGDSMYTERPAFAANPTGPGVVQTPFGALDPNPDSGQIVIPRNYGTGPSYGNLHLRVGRVFNFRSESGQNTSRTYSMTVTVQIQNLFNRTNSGAPVGNLSSPSFGRSLSAVGDFGSGRNSGGNRRIEAQVYWGF